MKLVPYDSPSLYVGPTPVTVSDLDMHRATTIPAMQELMLEIGAAGLTATSVGLDLAFFITRFERFSICLNPAYLPHRDAGFTSKPESSCLRRRWSTFVRRPNLIDAMWFDDNGKLHHERVSGMDARVFMHLADSVNGIQIWTTPSIPVQ